MNILLIGGAGYVGSVIARWLAVRGHDVRVADLFLFSKPSALARYAKAQVLNSQAMAADDFAGVDVVLNLAALSNDPAGELDSRATRLINVDARARAAALARDAGVRRYILFSSCSVYGANDNIVDEGSPLNPLTAYAAANVRAEKDVLDLSDDDFGVTVLRLATVFGVSPSMRFDLSINTMTLDAFSKGRIRVNGDGLQYRPFIHVDDVARAVEITLGIPVRAIGGEVFNIVNFNLRIRDLAERICALFDGSAACDFNAANADFRNYCVSGARAEHLLDFVPQVDLEQGAGAVRTALEEGRIQPSFTSTRLNGYRQLVADMKLDRHDHREEARSLGGFGGAQSRLQGLHLSSQRRPAPEAVEPAADPVRVSG